ncbi:hypothetical protein Tco_0566277 [Tanacetum coccineum]
MLEHLIYYGERVTRSPHVYDCMKPNAPWDIHPVSRSAEMFSLTYGIRSYHIHTKPSARSHFTMMEGLINRLRKIKSVDDLRVKSLLSKKCLVDEVNDDLVTKRTHGFFFDPLTKKRMAAPNQMICNIVAMRQMSENTMGGMSFTVTRKDEIIAILTSPCLVLSKISRSEKGTTVLLVTSWYCESGSYVVSLHKWESQKICVQRTMSLTTGLYINVERSHGCTLKGTRKRK